MKSLNIRDFFSKRTKRDAAFVIAGMLVFAFTFPVLFCEFNSGSVGGSAVGVFFVCVGLSGLTVKKAFGCEGVGSRTLRILIRCAAGAILTGFVWAAVCGVFVIYRANVPSIPDEDDGGTVIILGCLVRGDVPGQSLERRINKGYELLKKYPSKKCVLTGGKGPGENVAEAEAMKKALVGMGISEDRLYIENRSANTEENIRFASEIIEENGLDKNVIVVTQSYHQARASLFCKKYGLSSAPANAESELYTYPSYFIRELFGITHSIFYGY